MFNKQQTVEINGKKYKTKDLSPVATNCINLIGYTQQELQKAGAAVAVHQLALTALNAELEAQLAIMEENKKSGKKADA